MRLPRDARDNLDALRQVLVGGSEGRDTVPLGQLAAVRVVPGPAMIRDENAMLTGYVYLDLDGRDAEEYIAEASGRAREELEAPAGYTSPGADSTKPSAASTCASSRLSR